MDARRSEAPPHELGALSRELLEALPGGVVYVESDGAIAWVNAEAVTMLGLSFQELVQRYAADFEHETVHEDGSPCSPDEYPVTRALTTGQAQKGKTIGVKRPNGTTLWAVFSALPVKDAN